MPGTECGTRSSGCGLVLRTKSCKDGGENVSPTSVVSGNYFGSSSDPFSSSKSRAMMFKLYLHFYGKNDIPDCKDGPSGASDNNVVLKDIEISIPVSYDLLQQSSAQCPPGTPIFRGIDVNGNYTCLPLPYNCAAGAYLNAVDPSTLKQKCFNIPGTNPNCGSAQILSSYTWSSSGQIVTNCLGRLSPFDVFPMPAGP